ncbi:SGNH/GDSL hydrolase family protein [Oryzihumus leptocrescens]|uniref:GDSL-like lipase/acylhydrolase family protein n=1 Tax=Oryzihumus leptocrescens TaxID=297536 RepID=A0A542ZNB0_9MICO|nr:SGNH/GDSL hydrolase family protein [Oryzihumus leptocrescens]TQL61874.1 GDSL-like lipase/acylhydrolase family protein [Oryzihumus leptocrescens]
MSRTLAVVLAAAAVLGGTVASALPSTAATGPLRYVALGDSYSAASGVLPPDPTAPPACLRSTRNYPHVIAGATHAQLTDVTCGAAQTKDYAGAQYPGVTPQLDAVRPDTQLVTMTIGGNDNNTFINAITRCGAAGVSTLGTGSPCRDRYGSSFVDDIRTSTYPALVRALSAVRAKAPGARVAILGYPWILPERQGCFDRMPIATGDVPYLRGIEATLNDAVRRAAAATGATYVDLSAVSEGHDACQAIGVRWVEPVLQGTNPVIVHPNALGESRMATQTMGVLGLG